MITTAEKLNSGRIPAINRNLSNRNFQILTEMLKILIKNAIIGQFFIEFCKIFYKISAFKPEFCEILAKRLIVIEFLRSFQPKFEISNRNLKFGRIFLPAKNIFLHLWTTKTVHSIAFWYGIFF